MRLDAQSGDLSDAVRLWQDAFRRSPGSSEIGIDLARAFCADEAGIQSLPRKDGRLDRIQLNKPLDPGHAGGPVLDRHGKVVGVATATVPGAAINFAIAPDRLSDFLKAPGLLVSAPDVTWDNRAALSRWRFKVVPPTPNAALPADLAVVVTVADGIGKPRRFRAEPTRRLRCRCGC